MDLEKQALKEQNQALNEENQALNQLIASCKSCSRKKEANLEVAMAKEPQSDESTFIEGFGQLGLDDVLEVMKNLTGKELLMAMEVSESWKDFIGGQSLLINRAVNEVVMIPDLSDCTKSELENMFNKSHEKRPFKHMIIGSDDPFSWKMEFYLNPALAFAATLETLEICEEYVFEDDEDNDFAIYDSILDDKVEEFPRLRMLKYNGKFYNKLAKFFFPACTHLQIKNQGSNEEDDVKQLPKALSNFPKLKFLHSKLRVGDWWEYTKITDPMTIEGTYLSKLEQVAMLYYLPPLMKESHNSLQVLELWLVNWLELSIILRDLKKLKQLTFGKIDLDVAEHPNFQQNDSIEVLRVLIGGDLYWTGEEADFLAGLKDMLKALPSLKEFLFNNPIDRDMIQFIGKILQCIGLKF